MFDNQYKNRKDKRKRYYGAKFFDRSCRNHGSCSYCKDSRLHSSRKRIEQYSIIDNEIEHEIDSQINYIEEMLEENNYD